MENFSVPLFDGSKDPESWLQSMEDYFEDFHISMEAYVKICIDNLRGEAAIWAMENELIISRNWCAFCYKLLWKFAPSTKVFADKKSALVEKMQEDPLLFADGLAASEKEHETVKSDSIEEINHPQLQSVDINKSAETTSIIAQEVHLGSTLVNFQYVAQHLFDEMLVTSGVSFFTVFPLDIRCIWDKTPCIQNFDTGWQGSDFFWDILSSKIQQHGDPQAFTMDIRSAVTVMVIRARSHSQKMLKDVTCLLQGITGYLLKDQHISDGDSVIRKFSTRYRQLYSYTRNGCEKSGTLKVLILCAAGFSTTNFCVGHYDMQTLCCSSAHLVHVASSLYLKPNCSRLYKSASLAFIQVSSDSTCSKILCSGSVLNVKREFIAKGVAVTGQQDFKTHTHIESTEFAGSSHPIIAWVLRTGTDLRHVRLLKNLHSAIYFDFRDTKGRVYNGQFLYCGYQTKLMERNVEHHVFDLSVWLRAAGVCYVLKILLFGKNSPHATTRGYIKECIIIHTASILADFFEGYGVEYFSYYMSLLRIGKTNALRSKLDTSNQVHFTFKGVPIFSLLAPQLRTTGCLTKAILLLQDHIKKVAYVLLQRDELILSFSTKVHVCMFRRQYVKVHADVYNIKEFYYNGGNILVELRGSIGIMWLLLVMGRKRLSVRTLFQIAWKTSLRVGYGLLSGEDTNWDQLQAERAWEYPTHSGVHWQCIEVDLQLLAASQKDTVIIILLSSLLVRQSTLKATDRVGMLDSFTGHVFLSSIIALQACHLKVLPYTSQCITLQGRVPSHRTGKGWDGEYSDQAACCGLILAILNSLENSFSHTLNHCGFVYIGDHGLGKLQWPDCSLIKFQFQLTILKRLIAFHNYNYVSMRNSGATISLLFLEVYGSWVAGYTKDGLFFIRYPLAEIGFKLQCYFLYAVPLALQLWPRCSSVLESTTILTNSGRSTVVLPLRDHQAATIVGNYLWHLIHPMLYYLPEKSRCYRAISLVHIIYSWLKRCKTSVPKVVQDEYFVGPYSTLILQLRFPPAWRRASMSTVNGISVMPASSKEQYCSLQIKGGLFLPNLVPQYYYSSWIVHSLVKHWTTFTGGLMIIWELMSRKVFDPGVSYVTKATAITFLVVKRSHEQYQISATLGKFVTSVDCLRLDEKLLRFDRQHQVVCPSLPHSCPYRRSVIASNHQSCSQVLIQSMGSVAGFNVGIVWTKFQKRYVSFNSDRLQAFGCIYFYQYNLLMLVGCLSPDKCHTPGCGHNGISSGWLGSPTFIKGTKFSIDAAAIPISVQEMDFTETLYQRLPCTRIKVTAAGILLIGFFIS